MKLMRKQAVAGVVAAIMTMGAGLNAAAETIQITVTNTAQTGGLSLTPLYFGFHDGSVDLFDAGGTASAGIEEIAETGMFGTLRDERLAQQADSVGGVAVGGGGAIPGPIEPGESATFTVELDSVLNRFLFFASMVLPSNDTFVGVDDPTQFSLFDDLGNFLGPQTIDITSAFAYDSGTEENDPANGPAFVQGQDIDAGGPGEGSIQAAMSLNDFVGLALAGGLTLDPDVIDFINDPNFVFARIEISQVPLPPAVLLMGLGLGALGFKSRRKKA